MGFKIITEVQATGDFNNYKLRVKQKNQILAVVTILVAVLAFGIITLNFLIGENDIH